MLTVQRHESVHAMNERMNAPRQLSSGQLDIDKHEQISIIYFLFQKR